MFNLKRKNIMTYAFNNLFDELLNETPTVFRDVYYNQGNYSINTTKDGMKELMVNVAGHNPKDVEVNVTENEIHIQAKAEKVNSVIGDVNLKFSVGKHYDGTTSQASIENGVLTILLDKKDEKKGKKLNIKF
jgi:HSP20 family molecular chaperone IbpA